MIRPVVNALTVCLFLFTVTRLKKATETAPPQLTKRRSPFLRLAPCLAAPLLLTALPPSPSRHQQQKWQRMRRAPEKRQKWAAESDLKSIAPTQFRLPITAALATCSSRRASGG
jgi:hypothetical protein